MAIDSKKIDQLAERLRRAGETGKAIAPIRDELPDVASAYAVQQANTSYWLAQGRRLVGRKIGLTSVAVQKQLGVDQPDYGMLYADMALADGEEVPLARLMQPKVEAEVALVLGGDLDSADVTPAELMTAVDYAVARSEEHTSELQSH